MAGRKKLLRICLTKQPRRGELRRWCARKRREKRGSEARLRQRLEMAEARGREDGSGGRRRRISASRSSSSSGELGHRRRLAIATIHEQ
jgi:hypothetical protein